MHPAEIGSLEEKGGAGWLARRFREEKQLSNSAVPNVLRPLAVSGPQKCDNMLRKERFSPARIQFFFS